LRDAGDCIRAIVYSKFICESRSWGGSDINSRTVGIVSIPRLLLVLVLTPHTAYGETFGSFRYDNPGMFEFDYPGRNPIEPFRPGQKQNRVSSSFKPEFRVTEYHTLPQGQQLQQRLLRMGFKFRELPEASVQVEKSPQYRPQSMRGVAEYPWSSDSGSIVPAPIFRPLGNVGLKKSENISVGGVVTMPTPAMSYGQSGYATELPGYTPAGPVFRPIP
jgi:hypothetical protein